MPITATDTVSTSSSPASTTNSWSHTATGNGLCVEIMIVGNDAVLSVTFNGVAMTPLWDSADSGAFRNVGYFMRNPAAGAHVVLVTFATPADSFCVARGMAGMETSSDGAAHGTVANGSGGGVGTPSIAIPSAPGDLVFSGVTCGTASIAADQTLEAKTDNLFGNSESGGLESSTAVGSSTVHSWTPVADGDFWGAGGVAFKAAAAADTLWAQSVM